jgi:hypothetical protein
MSCPSELKINSSLQASSWAATMLHQVKVMWCSAALSKFRLSLARQCSGRGSTPNAWSCAARRHFWGTSHRSCRCWGRRARSTCHGQSHHDASVFPGIPYYFYKRTNIFHTNTWSNKPGILRYKILTPPLRLVKVESSRVWCCWKYLDALRRQEQRCLILRSPHDVGLVAPWLVGLLGLPAAAPAMSPHALRCFRSPWWSLTTDGVEMETGTRNPSTRRVLGMETGLLGEGSLESEVEIEDIVGDGAPPAPRRPPAPPAPQPAPPAPAPSESESWAKLLWIQGCSLESKVEIKDIVGDGAPPAPRRPPAPPAPQPAPPTPAPSESESWTKLLWIQGCSFLIVWPPAPLVPRFAPTGRHVA